MTPDQFIERNSKPVEKINYFFLTFLDSPSLFGLMMTLQKFLNSNLFINIKNNKVDREKNLGIFIAKGFTTVFIFIYVLSYPSKRTKRQEFGDFWPFSKSPCVWLAFLAL
jgi:hypothetical protein